MANNPNEVYLFLDLDSVFPELQRLRLPIEVPSLAQELASKARAINNRNSSFLVVSQGTDDRTVGYDDWFRNHEFRRIGGPTRRESVTLLSEELRRVHEGAAVVLVSNDFDNLRNDVAWLADMKKCWIKIWGVEQQDHWHVPGADYDYLPDQLNLRPTKVGLFIDFENVAINLAQNGFAIDLDVIAALFKERAEEHGRLVRAVAYADWTSLHGLIDSSGQDISQLAPRILATEGIRPEYAVTTGGKNVSDMLMVDELRNELERPKSPDGAIDTFIVASGDADFRPVIQSIVRQGRQVEVWGVRGATNIDLYRDTAVKLIDDFPGLQRRPQKGATPAQEASESLESSDASPKPYTALLWQMRQAINSSMRDCVTLSWLRQKINDEHRALIPEGEDALWVVNQLVFEGFVVKERREHDTNPEYHVWCFRPDETNSLVRTHFGILRAISEHLAEAEKLIAAGRLGYASFSWLDRALSVPQTNVDAQSVALNISQRQEWINFAISQRIIETTRRPHHRNPRDTVTALHLPVRVAESDADTASQMERRIFLGLLSFMSRTKYTWMSIKTLRQRVEPSGPVSVQPAFDALLQRGDLLLHEYENPGNPNYKTRGVSLGTTETNAARWSEVSQIVRSLVETATLGNIDEHLWGEWVRALEAEGLVRSEMRLGSPQKTFVLNRAHPLCEQLLTEEPPGDRSTQGEPN